MSARCNTKYLCDFRSIPIPLIPDLENKIWLHFNHCYMTSEYVLYVKNINCSVCGSVDGQRVKESQWVVAVHARGRIQWVKRKDMRVKNESGMRSEY